MNEISLHKKEFLTSQAKSCLKRMTADIIELSRIAHEYHQEFGYQEYIAWVGELGLSEWMGSKMLNVFDKFGSVNFTVNNIQPSILYLLSAPSTPESARIEAIEKTESGEKLSVKDTKELIEAHKRIDDLEKQLADAKNQIPTEDVQEKISVLEKQLEVERNKPAVIQTVEKITEVIKTPDDYLKIKKEHENNIRLIEDLKKREQKTKDESKSSIEKIESLRKVIEKQDAELKRWDWSKKEFKAVGLVSDAAKNIKEATVLMNDPRGGGICPETVILMVKDVQSYCQEFLKMYENAAIEVTFDDSTIY